MQRYLEIPGTISEIKPQTIVEIGTWNGDRAISMVSAALLHNDTVYYEGYDLFEDATEETDKEEMNVKKNYSIEEIISKLEEFKKENPGFEFNLIKGNTRETLHNKFITSDFVFIDGGHSVETIENDYKAVENSPFVLFDDYYTEDEQGRCADISAFGANKIVDNITKNKIIFESNDPVVTGGIVHLVLVYN